MPSRSIAPSLAGLNAGTKLSVPALSTPRGTVTSAASAANIGIVEGIKNVIDAQTPIHSIEGHLILLKKTKGGSFLVIEQKQILNCAGFYGLLESFAVCWELEAK